MENDNLKKHIFIFLLPLVFVSASCFTYSQDQLYGKWKEYQTETESGNKNGPDDIPLYAGTGMEWEFDKDSISSYYENQKEWTLSYSLRSDTLTILTPRKGTSLQYIIEKVDNDILILLDTRRQPILNNERLRHYFKKQ